MAKRTKRSAARLTRGFDVSKPETWPAVLTLPEMAALYRLGTRTMRGKLQAGTFRPRPWKKYPYRWERETVIAAVMPLSGRAFKGPAWRDALTIMDRRRKATNAELRREARDLNRVARAALALARWASIRARDLARAAASGGAK